MAETLLHLDVITPDRRVFSGAMEDVLLPGVEGEFGVLKGHTPFLSGLDYGVMSYTPAEGGKKEFYIIGQGYAEVTGAKVIVLIETARSLVELDVEQAQKDKEKLQERLAKLSPEDPEAERIKKEIRVTEALIKVASTSSKAA